MVLTRNEALNILNLKEDADKGAIRQSYKELALRWHPDKNADPETATKKFQEISCAYKKLMSDGDEEDDDYDDEDVMTADDMFALFRHIYFTHGAGVGAGVFSSLLEEMMQERMHGYAYDDDPAADCYDSGDVDDEDFHDDDDFFDYDAGGADFFMPSSHFREEAGYASNYRRFHPVTEEEARRNAEELMKEEEKEKAEAKKKEDKRKNKNKRKKEAKKRKKAAQTTTEKPKQQSAAKKSSSDVKSEDEVEDDEDAEKATEEGLEGDFDMSSAFVRSRAGAVAAASGAATAATTATAVGSKTSQESSGGIKDTSNSSHKKPPSPHTSVGQATPAQAPLSEEVDDVTVQARSYAMRGNELAQLGHYQAAIDMFSEAIKLHGSDHRYYGNRSFCYDRLAQYHSAENDATKAIDLSPEWPKGYFRRARALAGQRLWKQAEECFEVVLALDPSCTDAWVELKKIRAYQLQEMGFSHEQSLLAVDKYQNVPQALDALLSGAILQKDPDVEAVYVSDDEAGSAQASSSSVQFTTRDDLCTPNATTGICSIWVGNVNHTYVNQAHLRSLFEKYGEISSVRLMPAKHCVFINYRTAQAAANAMKELQGYFFGDMNLSIRYPDSYLPSQETSEPARSNGRGGARSNGHRDGAGHDGGRAKAAAPRQRPVGALARAAAARQRDNHATVTPRGTVTTATSNGTPAAVSTNAAGRVQECSHWRANGCKFGKRCRYVHVPEHKGIDIR